LEGKPRKIKIGKVSKDPPPEIVLITPTIKPTTIKSR